ncbi:MAG: glycerol-3-phosphate dehydrogenase/oxidase [Chitinophagales bacterium]|nr:glycerol-3-phosphate dehydrogenase/oxidase [Chitinophagales bacterium]
MNSRAILLEKASQEEFDLCIIGGGITGAGILIQAVQSGYKAILIEKNDFASGTSSRSSKMIHGGVRYLKYLQLKLVKEALHERQHLLEIFPHLVKPFPFILPSYNSTFDLLTKEVGLSLYDTLAGKSDLSHHKRLKTKDVIDKLSGIQQKGLKGGILYWDARTNDARLTVDAITLATQQGALAFNYLEACSPNKESGNVQSLECRDALNDTKVAIRAKVYINATGVWTDDVLRKLAISKKNQMQPTKGVHVVVSSSKFPKDYVAIVTSENGDKRFLYTLPWEHNMTILGATDTEFTGSVDNVQTSLGDVDYILGAFKHSFPQVAIEKKDIISVFAGLRPLLKDDHEDAYSRSREYKIWWEGNNLLNISGGKLTSFLSMGQHCIDEVKNKLQQSLSNKSIFSHDYKGEWKDKYGEFGVYIDQILAEDVNANQVLSTDFPYLIAELIFFTRFQKACQLEDMLTRRLTVTYAMKEFDIKLVEKVAKLMANELNQDETWISSQIEKYQQHWKEYHPDFLNE